MPLDRQAALVQQAVQVALALPAVPDRPDRPDCRGRLAVLPTYSSIRIKIRRPNRRVAGKSDLTQLTQLLLQNSGLVTLLRPVLTLPMFLRAYVLVIQSMCRIRTTVRAIMILKLLPIQLSNLATLNFR